MSDVVCILCGEPWEAYSVYHEFTPQERQDFKRGEGCPSCEGKPEQGADLGKQGLAQGILDLYGDDLDALAADTEDGLLDSFIG